RAGSASSNAPVGLLPPQCTGVTALTLTSPPGASGDFLAVGAIISAAAGEFRARDRRPAAPAFQSVAAVDVQAPREVSAFSVHIDVQRIEAGAAGGQRIA